jgi:hypothetical protein
MQVETSLVELAGLPAVAGPHALAWLYILDCVFADAHATGLSRMNVVLPSKTLLPDVELRADLTPGAEAGGPTGHAGLSAAGSPGRADRLYLLRFGALAARSLQTRSPAVPKGYRCVAELSALTWKARLWGVPILLSVRLGRSDLTDRAMYAMRRDFASADHTPAYYHLTTWARV